jgi:HEAT repeat protein
MNAKTDDPTLRSRVILALSRAPRPSPAAVKALKAMLTSDPFSEQALLGLGTYSRRFRDQGDDKDAAEIGGLLIDRIGAAKSTLQVMTVLRAITNSGYSPAIEKVVPYLTDEREEVRVVAVRALQSMRDPSVDPILAERLQADSSNDVRISALRAAKIREASDVLARAVEAAAIGAQDPHVRYRAVELLIAWAPRRADLRPTLQQVANGEQEQRIRELARGAL